MQQRRRVHEALAPTLDANPDRRGWHRAALVSGTDEKLARELEEAGVRAQHRDAIDVALTALRRAVELSAPSHRAGRMFATAELAYERGRPDIARPMLRAIDGLDLEPVEVARARFLSELIDARALADRGRLAGLIAIAEQAGAEGDRRPHRLVRAIRGLRRGGGVIIRPSVVSLPPSGPMIASASVDGWNQACRPAPHPSYTKPMAGTRTTSRPTAVSPSRYRAQPPRECDR